jgi:hypothetical protein
MKKSICYLMCGMLALSLSCEDKEEARFSVEYTPTSIAAAGGETSFNIQASGAWNTSKTASWITLAPEAGTGNQTVTVKVAANENAAQNTTQRTADIHVSSGTNTETLTITQEGKSHPSLSAPTLTSTASECPDETVLLEVTPLTGAVSYVWYRNGEVIPTVAGTSYTVTEPGTYAVAGVNVAGIEGIQSQKVVDIIPCTAPKLPAPVITGDAENTCPAETVPLEITPVDGAVSYVWYKDGEVIPDATTASYIVTEPGTYTVAGMDDTDLEGEMSDEKVVNINPCILSAPVINILSETACEVELTLTEPVDGAVSYIWYKDGDPIPDATTASYTVTASGIYTVAAVNAAGTTGEQSIEGYAASISPCPPEAAGDIEGADANDPNAGAATSKAANTVELTAPEIKYATSYTWYYNGGDGEVEMQTGTSRIYTAVISGSYTVKGVNEADAGALSPVKVVNITPRVALVYDANYNQFICRKSLLNTDSGNNMVDPFLSIYDEAEAGFNAAGTVTHSFFRMRVTAASTFNFGIISTINGLSSINYTINTASDGTITFTSPANSTSALIKGAANMVAYLAYSGSCTLGPGGSSIVVQPSGNKFRLGWIPNNNGQTGILFGLYLVSDPRSYIPGALTKY